MTRPCGLCERLAAGFTQTKFSADISPWCEACSERTGKHCHHFGECKVPNTFECHVCHLQKPKREFLGVSPWHQDRKVYGNVCLDCRIRREVERNERVTTILMDGAGLSKEEWAALSAPGPVPSPYGRKAGVRKPKWTN